MNCVTSTAVLLLLWSQASPDAFESGRRAYAENNYAQAYSMWMPLAKAGVAHVQHHIGRLYENGLGVKQDFDEARRWYARSAAQGYTHAAYNLGLLHFDGQFTSVLGTFGRTSLPQNYGEAMKWFRQAAERGHGAAQFYMGLMYAWGMGVPKDDANAVTWYRLAAQNGYTYALDKLGFHYASGSGVPCDLIEAYRWYNLAAAFQSGWAVDERDRIARSMTPAQVAEAQKLSSDWFAKHGSKRAQ